MKTQNLLFRTKDWLEGTSYICVILGIIFAVVQYLEAKDSERRTAAISYIQGFQESEIVNARIALQRDWLPYPVQAISGRTGSSDVIDNLAMSFVFPVDRDEVNADDLIRVVDYLDVLGTCVATEVCDPSVVEEHLNSYVHSIGCLYGAPLKRLREEHNLSQLGLSMLDISGIKRDCR